VGRPLPAADARERVSGAAEFAVDVEVPGMLHAKVLRSTEPHGRIARLDAGAAEKMPGVVAVLTGSDLLTGGIASHYGPIFPDRPLVAIDRVRYAGEPVAVVIAREAHEAAAALERIGWNTTRSPATSTRSPRSRPTPSRSTRTLVSAASSPIPTSS
jgi:CO/xanthine dehydrogenase Mo-binding subunit